MNATAIAKLFGLKRETVRDTIARWHSTGSADPPKRPGRKNVLTARDERALIRITTQNRFTPLGEITSVANQRLVTNLAPNTIRKYLHENGLRACKACEKPLLKESHIMARLKWCKERCEWGDDEWKRIVWSDESRFALFNSDGRQRVWRRVDEKYHIDCVRPTVKYGGGSVMFWGCFGWDGVGPLVLVEETMNQDTYVNVLANNYIPWIRERPEVMFQQDGAPCHRGQYTTWWLQTHGVDVLSWVRQSPDLNPIEHLWDLVDRNVRKLKRLPKNVEELKAAIMDEWSAIGVETCRDLIRSMPCRVKSVIEARGLHTKY